MVPLRQGPGVYVKHEIGKKYQVHEQDEPEKTCPYKQTRKTHTPRAPPPRQKRPSGSEEAHYVKTAAGYSFTSRWHFWRGRGGVGWVYLFSFVCFFGCFSGQHLYLERLIRNPNTMTRKTADKKKTHTGDTNNPTPPPPPEMPPSSKEAPYIDLHFMI